MRRRQAQRGRMARHSVGKANPDSAGARNRSRREKVAPKAIDGTLRERLAAAERERDALRIAFDREQARVRKLEEANAVARDRIAWALDSLQSILEPKR